MYSNLSSLSGRMFKVRSQLVHLATWNEILDIWTTPPQLTSERLAVFSETWTPWGMTVNGDAYMPPRREPFTKEPASSSQPQGAKLLPTPTVSDAKGTGQSDLRRNTVPLRGIPLVDMAQYAEAIAHQEGVTGVPAPEPTVPNRNGREKLNPAFVEWMMMLPPGYVTEVPDITDTEALMLLGNGVVPQQAILALESLLDL